MERSSLYWDGAQDSTGQEYCMRISSMFPVLMFTGIVLCMCPANERRRYIVTSSLIGWAHSQNCVHQGQIPALYKIDPHLPHIHWADGRLNHKLSWSGESARFDFSDCFAIWQAL